MLRSPVCKQYYFPQFFPHFFQISEKCVLVKHIILTEELFASVLRSTIEEIYRLGGSYGIKFDELPSLTYFSTKADLVLMRQYTVNYHQRIWHRIDKFVLNRVPVASPIQGSFIVNTLAAEIVTYVMAEATKEKTRQVLAIMDKNNSNSAVTVESASASKKDNKENCAINGANSIETETETESTSSMNPVIGFGPQSISTLLAIKS